MTAPTGRLVPLRTIRAKLTVIVAVPTTLLVLLAVVGVVSQWRSVDDAKGAAKNIDLVLATETLVTSLQRERGLTNGLLGGRAGYRSQVDAQRGSSDRELAALNRMLRYTDSASARAVRAVLDRFGDLASIRGSVDVGHASQADTLAFYTSEITALNDAAFTGDSGRDDPALGRGLDALRTLADATEATALERGFLNGVFAAGEFRGGEYARFSEIRATRVDRLAQFRRIATPDQNQALAEAERIPQATMAAALERHALAGAAGRRLGVDPIGWWDAMTKVVDELRQVQVSVSADVRARAHHITWTSLWLLGAYIGFAAFIFVVALLLWLMSTRSIMYPLSQLTSEANDTATRRLPEAVSQIQASDDPGELDLDAAWPAATLVRRSDEFAEVAAALDNVQRTAVRLAAEQAVMRHNTAESLANLGRRNQNLVRRLLGLISALEREETDPTALANLFELDHLATRMRRNAESVLVLVGEHSPRRWSGSVDAGDVLRSAFAEVEDYRRIVLRHVDDAQVRGTVAADISHLLAELIENALTFSPPDRDVEIQARDDGTRYRIAIVDQGVGMSAAALATANARLKGEKTFVVAPTRYLGHYVVGQLARRLGIEVRLHDSPLTGVTAQITLPRSLLVPPDAPALASQPARERLALAGAPSAAPAPAPAPAPMPSGNAPVMTRNGLIKRVPKASRPARPDPARRRYVADAQADPQEADRSPRDVRAMLDSFRSGIHQAERERKDQQR